MGNTGSNYSPVTSMPRVTAGYDNMMSTIMAIVTGQI